MDCGFLKFICICVWLCWVSVAARGFSVVTASGGSSLGAACGLLAELASLAVASGF